MTTDRSHVPAVAREIIVGMIRPHLHRIWCRETASPSCQAGWPSPHPSYGQCAVTALLIQDALGGELLRREIPGHGSHYSNVLPDGQEIDLTREQFPADLVMPEGVIVPRSRLLEGERAEQARTAERYAMLRGRSGVLDDAVDAYMVEKFRIGILLLGKDFFDQLEALRVPDQAVTGAPP